MRIEASVIFTELFRGYVGEMLAYDSGSESWCQLRLDHLSSVLLQAVPPPELRAVVLSPPERTLLPMPGRSGVEN